MIASMEPSLPLRRGVVFILSSPSGAGKTTLTRMMLQNRDLDLNLSISVTTRSRRSSEVDGIHYRFISERQFITMRDASELLEWAEVHGNYYGTPRAAVETILSQGRDCLFDIDYQGTRQVREKLPLDTVSVFILPPSMKELRLRLERRAEDASEVIERRLENARKEIARWKEYDYVLINDDLQQSFDDLIAILHAERQKRPRRERGLDKFIAQLLSE
ncbi:MAG: guanylate kinase [Methylocystis sp.]